MRLLYKPLINLALRSIARPFSGLIPQKYWFPVTGVITVKLPEGKKIRMQCNPTSYVAKALFWEGVDGYGFNVVRIFIELVKEAQVFVDIGANIGYFSLVASAFNPPLRVVSFEPLPAAHHYLKANADLNQFVNITAEQRALSDEEGEVQFFASKNPKFLEVEHQLTSTGSLDKGQAARTDLLEAIQIKTETLDHYVEQHKLPRIDLIKLDAEASEHLVLAGADRVLAEQKPVVICEVLPGKIEERI